MNPSSLPIDIYIRVSRVNGRDGESFISPKEQEDRCRAQLAADGYEVGGVYIDLDESGATQDRPAFNEVMQRVRDGASGGISVARLNRFGRTTRGVLDDIAEIEEAGAVFLAVEEKLDTSTSIGRFVLRMFASLAELELDRIREGWATTHADMVGRGVQSGRTPSGYSRGVDKRLVPNEHAHLVVEAYARRAKSGSSWRELALWLTESGLPTQSGNPWHPSAVRSLIANRVYLGEVKHGSMVQTGAHEALVDEDTFNRANRKGQKPLGTNGVGHLLGGGLVRCGVCGQGMVRTTTTRRGKKYEFLRCHTRGDGHPSIAFRPTQEFLVRAALKRLELTEGEYVDQRADLELAERLAAALEEIEELERQFEDGEISPSVYAKAATKAEAERDLLRDTLAVSGTTGTVIQVNRRAKADRDAARHLLLTFVGDEAVEHVPGEIANARRLLHETLGHVEVAPGRGPIESRITIA